MSSATKQAERELALAAFADTLRAQGLDFAETVPESARGYTLTNWVRGERVLEHVSYGSYQGEWLTFAFNPLTDEYRIYKGWYGSCSGCDAWQGSSVESMLEGRWNDEYTERLPNPDAVRGNPQVLDWALDYPAYIEIPRMTAVGLALNGVERFKEIVPANMRGDFDESVDFDSFSRDAIAHIKLDQNLGIEITDIFGTPNAELRRRLMEAYGIERVVTDAGFNTLDTDGADSLVAAPDGLVIGIGRERPVFLFLKDSSTPRRYLLRVPPTMQRVREAKAWTFGINEREYNPVVET